MSEIKSDDLFLIHREGKDYKATVDQFAKDIHINVDACCEDPNDGKLTLKDSKGDTVGEFTANQAGDTEVTLPQGFSGSYDDLTNKPTEFPPSPHVHDYNDLLNKPTIGDGTITVKDSDGTSVGSFTVNQEGDIDVVLPPVVIPDSLHPKGFINVDDPAPADPEHGDIYIQHKDDLSDGVADASFAPGIPTGTAVEEGTFVMFGVDDLWHAGGNANSTQVQADWAETNPTEPSFIKNKGVYMPLDLRTLPALP